jgi:O-acetylserine/cysteine efflux transporter
VFFVRPPKASPWIVALYGLFIGVGQFGLLFVAIRQGFPVGLASLIIQLQAFFTIFLAWTLMRERPRRAQLIGAGVAFIGVALIGSRRLDGASLLPFLMVIAAAAFWGAGNIAAKFAGRVDMLAFVSWSSLAPPVPLFLLSVIVEGRGGLASLAHPSLRLVLAVLVLSYAATLFGFGLWARLLSHYSAAAVAPFALLVPIVGMAAGSAVFGEPFGLFELWGALLVMAGLGFNLFGDRLLRRRLQSFG